MFAKISHAYEIIKDEDTRKSYNLSQLHNDQKGYDPNGPAYYDSSR
jgi:curved DNA-binding protein CbpA